MDDYMSFLVGNAPHRVTLAESEVLVLNSRKRLTDFSWFADITDIR